MEKLLLRESEARAVVGLGKTKFYELLASGAIPSFKVGRARVVPTSALRQWIADQLGAEREASAVTPEHE